MLETISQMILQSYLSIDLVVVVENDAFDAVIIILLLLIETLQIICKYVIKTLQNLGIGCGKSSLMLW